MLASHAAFPMIAVRNLAQARAFYEGVLGLDPISPKDDGHVAMYNSFFFNDTVTTEIYTLTLRDALPI